MADSLPSDKVASPDDPSIGAAIPSNEQISSLLKAKDDTSRFVGLALLKTVLDNQPNLRENEILVNDWWHSISSKFLDRLLKAGDNESIFKGDAKDMVAIAVAVIHTFATLLPDEARAGKRLVGRTTGLLNATVNSSPETTTMIIQTLLTIVSNVKGACEFVAIEDISPLIEIAPNQPLVLDVFDAALANAASEDVNIPAVRKLINKMLPALIISFKQTDAVTLLAFIGSILPKIPSQILPGNPGWLSSLTKLIQGLVRKRPTIIGRAAYTEASAALLQIYPAAAPGLLFGNSSESGLDPKPFSNLFINLLLIDIRSSFPSLLAKINSPEYLKISRRLAAAFDIVSSFIGFLVRSLDDDETEDSKVVFSMPPDLLLIIRKDVSETMSLSIEFLRDRWDASVAGAAGLHPSARTEPASTSEGTRLTIAWDTKKDSLQGDQLILASFQTLAIWLTEDENESLRAEAAGLMDMMLELYSSSTSPGSLDFRYPVLMSLEAIIDADSAESFLTQNGWEVLTKDLSSLPSIIVPTMEASRGIEIVRVLLTVIDIAGSTREEWMALVGEVGGMHPDTTTSSDQELEMQIAKVQLAAALCSSASLGMQKRYTSNITAINGLATRMLSELVNRTKSMKDSNGVLQEFQDSLHDVLTTLHNIN